MVKKNFKKRQMSREDALSLKEVETILKHLKSDGDEMKTFVFVALVYGGFRASELAHMRRDWMHINDDYSKKVGVDYIQIPNKDVWCDCYDCRLQAFLDRESAKEGTIYNKTWYSEIRKKFKSEHEKGRYWRPKTKDGERKIPITYDIFRDYLTKFYSEHEKLYRSRNWIWGQINRLTKEIWGEHDEINPRTSKTTLVPNRPLYPHALRATTATLWSVSGMNATALKEIMGWSSIEIAEIYVQSDELQALKSAQDISDGKKTW